MAASNINTQQPRENGGQNQEKRKHIRAKVGLKKREEAMEKGSKVQLPAKMQQKITKYGWHIRGKVNLDNWTLREEEELNYLVSIKRMKDWDTIARALNTGRTGYQCYTFLKSKTFRFGDYGKDWTRHEMMTLQSLISCLTDEKRTPWGRIAGAMQDRTRLECYVKHEVDTQSTRMGRFLVEEDAVILSFVDVYGPRFDLLANILVGRSVDNLTARYNLLLKIQGFGMWTVEEDTKLIYIMDSWPFSPDKNILEKAEIAAFLNKKFFPGKAVHELKYRFKALEVWRRKNPSGDLSTGLCRGSWDQIQPPQELAGNLQLALRCLKDKLLFELASYRDAHTKKNKRAFKNATTQTDEQYFYEKPYLEP